MRREQPPFLVDIPSEDASVVEKLWVRRNEDDLVTWGSAYYDYGLRRLRTPSDAPVWLEVRLIRPRHAPECQAVCEIRTQFAIDPRGRGSREAFKLVREIGRLQELWKRRFGIPFPVYGAVKPYLRGALGELTRIEGKRTRNARDGEVVAVYGAVEVVAHAWEVSRRRRKDAGCDVVLKYLRYECKRRPGYYELLRPEDEDMFRSFAPPDGPREGGRRPRLCRRLVLNVGKQLGFLGATGRAAPAVRDLAPRTRRLRLWKLVADLVARRGEASDKILRTLVRPTLTGKFSGPLVLATEHEAKHRRRSIRLRRY